MGTGQMIITIGAMILLGNLILTANRGINNIQQTMLQSGYDLDAVSLARSTIEKAQDLPFDRHTMDSTWVNSLSQLTPPGSLGQESSTGDTLNDYDDYNGHQHGRVEIDTVNANGLLYSIYKDSTAVQYVTRASNGTMQPSPSAATWSKELDVYVWKYEPNAPKSVQASDSAASFVHMFDVYSYWY